MSKNLINGMKPEFGNMEQIKVLQKAERAIEDEKETKNFYKNLPPSEKYIDDLASIDWVFMVIEINTKKITEKLSGRNPIDKMVDQATGYEKSLLKEFLTDLKAGYKELIKLFKRIDDTDRAEQYKKLLEKINTNLKTEYKDIKPIKY